MLQIFFFFKIKCCENLKPLFYVNIYKYFSQKITPFSVTEPTYLFLGGQTCSIESTPLDYRCWSFFFQRFQYSGKIKLALLMMKNIALLNQCALIICITRSESGEISFNVMPYWSIKWPITIWLDQPIVEITFKKRADWAPWEEGVCRPVERYSPKVFTHLLAAGISLVSCNTAGKILEIGWRGYQGYQYCVVSKLDISRKQKFDQDQFSFKIPVTVSML